MKSAPSRRFDFDNPVMPGVNIELSNRTKINRSASFIFLTCPVCEVEFERKASEAKRHIVSYCGIGCRGIAQRVQVARSCVVCNAEYTVKKSMVNKITCCSRECRSKKQAELSVNSKLITCFNKKG